MRQFLISAAAFLLIGSVAYAQPSTVEGKLPQLPSTLGPNGGLKIECLGGTCSGGGGGGGSTPPITTSGVINTGGTLVLSGITHETAVNLFVTFTSFLSGELDPQASIDGTNWVYLTCRDLSNPNLNAITSDGIYSCDIGGFSHFRINGIFFDGSATVSIRAANGISFLPVHILNNSLVVSSITNVVTTRPQVGSVGHIICDSGCSSSSTLDRSVFIDGTTPVAPTGAIVDDVGTVAMSEGNVGALRMSTARLLYVDFALTQTNVAALKVNFGGTGQPVIASQSGVWNSQIWDGTNIAGVTSGNSLKVDIEQLAGAPIVSAGLPVTLTGLPSVIVAGSSSINIDDTTTTPGGAARGLVTRVAGTPTINVTQFGGTNVSTGTGTGGAGIPRVTVSSDSNIHATQSGTWTSTAPTLTKGTQGATGYSVQNLKDAGRTSVALSYTSTAPTTADTVVTVLIKASAGSAAAGATSITAAASKIFKLTDVDVSIRTTTAAVPWALVTLRMSNTTTCSASSSVVGYFAASGNAAVVGNVGSFSNQFQDGFDLVSGGSFCITVQGSLNTNVITFSARGFEY